jgi:TonB family protein
MREVFYVLGSVALLTLLVVLPSIGRGSDRAIANEPAVVAAVAPEFPLIARSAHAQGEVVVEVVLASDGTVQTSKSLSGHPLLQKAAENAAIQWKFAAVNEPPGKVRLVFSFGYAAGKKSDPELMITFMPPQRVEVRVNESRIPIIN